MPKSDGARDVVDILTEDHREVEALIVQIEASTDATQRRELADLMTSELVRHSVAEETVVYPAMRKHLPDGDKAVEHDQGEHKELERTLKDLEGLGGDDPEFARLIASISSTLQDHVKDEENEQFPTLRDQVPADQLRQMGEQVETVKRIAPTRPHPAAPNAAAFHLLVGPGVGLVDRLRDRLTGRATG